MAVHCARIQTPKQEALKGWCCFVTPKRALAQFFLLSDPLHCRPLVVLLFKALVSSFLSARCKISPAHTSRAKKMQMYTLLFILQQMPRGQFCFYCLCTSGGGKQKAACSCTVLSCTSKRPSTERGDRAWDDGLVSLRALKSFIGQRTAEIKCQRRSFF